MEYIILKSLAKSDIKLVEQEPIKAYVRHQARVGVEGFVEVGTAGGNDTDAVNDLTVGAAVHVGVGMGILVYAGTAIDGGDVGVEVLVAGGEVDIYQLEVLLGVGVVL